VTFSPYLRNDGPATALNPAAAIKFSITTDTPGSVYDPAGMAPCPIAWFSAIKSGETFDFADVPMQDTLPKNDIEKFQRRERLLNVQTVLFYDDEFGEKHFTSFCYSYGTLGDKSSFGPCGDPASNGFHPFRDKGQPCFRERR
jgi:hypothetical protein